MKHRIFTIVILLLAAAAAGGSPARRGTFLLVQPDGASFLAMLKGDEFCNVLMTAEGYPIIKDEDGFYKYAWFNADGSRESSGYKAGSAAPSIVLNSCRNIPWQTLRARGLARRKGRGSPNRVLPATRANAPVRKSCIILLAQFPDLSFRNEGTRQQDFIDLLTKESGKSALAYFNDQFQGNYEFSFEIGPIVTLSKGHNYYGDNQDDEEGQDAHPQELVVEACMLSDPYVDFSRFDNDGDGIVDNVFVFVAGKSEAEGGGADCLWPHQWYVPSLTLDGKRIYSYALASELTVQSQNSNGQLVWGLTNIGTFCHEYSHTLGLQDLYDTDGDGSGGEAKGLWFSTGLMDGGNFNDAGRTPPSYNALDREILGIGRPEKMTAGTWTLEPVDEKGRYLILENPNDSTEFFLFECRAQRGWDAYIGGSGLAVYHVDMSGNKAGWSDDAGKEVTALYRWQYNEVNCNPLHECADMMETSANAIDVSQAFFPYRTINSFNANSDPAFVFNDGTQSPFAIANIQRKGTDVTFTVYNSADIVPNVTDLKAEVYQDAVILTWRSDVENFDGEATVAWGEASGSSKSLSVSPFAPGEYSLTIEGLSPTTAYSASISFTRSGVSGESTTLDILTKASQSGRPPFIYLEYLSGIRQGGKFPAGTGLPLRVWNAIGEDVAWYYNGTTIRTDGSGYFHPASSGTLKAVVFHSDGTKDILSKDITIL